MNRKLLAAAFILALVTCLIPAGVQAQAFFATYPDINPVWAKSASAYDRYGDQAVTVGMRTTHILSTYLALDLILRGTTTGPTRFTYTAPIFDFKWSDFELVAIVPTPSTYTVFMNLQAHSTDKWTSYVIAIDRQNPTWVQAYRIRNPGAGADEFVRLRDVAEVKFGFAILGALDDEIIGATTFISRLAAGNVAWASTYASSEKVELFSLSREAYGLVAGGWIGDIDSWDVGEAVLLHVSQGDGSPTLARHYETVGALFDLPVEGSYGIQGTYGGVWVTGQHASGELIVFPVDSNLLPVGGAQAVVPWYFTPVDLAIDQNNAGVVMLDGGGGPRHTLRIGDLMAPWNQNGTLYDFGAISGFSNVQLHTLSSGSGYAVLGGGVYVNGGWPSPDQVLVSRTDGIGHMEYCVPSSTVSVHPVGELPTTVMQVASQPLSLTTEPVEIYGWYASEPYEFLYCH